MNCKNCNGTINEDANFCVNCGEKVEQEKFKEDHKFILKEGENFGGFWIRFGAYLIDYAIAFLFIIILILIFALLKPDVLPVLENLPVLADRLLTLLLVTFYHFLCLSIGSSTPGKYLFGLRVTDIEGKKVSSKRALKRSGLFILSHLFFGLGFLQIASNKNKQALHDVSAKTLVIRKNSKNLILPVFLSLIGLSVFLWAVSNSYNDESTNKATDSSLNQKEKVETEKPQASSQKFYSSNGNFSVLFVKTPNYELSSLPLEDGSLLPIHVYQAETENGNVEQVVYAEYPYSTDFSVPENNLLASVEGTKDGVKGKIISTTNFTYAGYPAINYNIYIPESNVYMKGVHVLKGYRYYSLDYAYEPATENVIEANEFLNSLEIHN